MKNIGASVSAVLTQEKKVLDFEREMREKHIKRMESKEKNKQK